jgi:hypothetical protein
MVKQDEVFYQVLENSTTKAPTTNSIPSTAASAITATPSVSANQMAVKPATK